MADDQARILPSPDDPIEIFISYAHDDNSVSPELKNAKGFVSALVDHLDYIFKKRGHPKPKLWWDQRRIDKTDRFDHIIQAAVKRSSLLLVVMSRNWLSRPWCRKELELFAARKQDDQHIVLVRANHVEYPDHPAELQNIQGYNFFSLDDWREPGNERFFFDRGEIQDETFLRHVDDLGSILWRRAHRIGMRTRPPPPPPPPPGRTIYLAKPASDMVSIYHRVANELLQQGHQVVPPLDQKIPVEPPSAALEFIDAALASADMSIHLLGEKPGYKPDELDHIVPLQLARAVERAERSGTKAAFSRIIWAPKSPEEGCDFSVADFRDPVAVLNRFNSYRPGDQVHGDVASAFLTYLKRKLVPDDPIDDGPVDPDKILDPDKADSLIYVWHRKDDREFARKVRKWLRAHDAEAVLPGNDEDADKDKLHRKNLAKCDAVFLCWAQATDVWAKMSAGELRSWRDLDRKDRFSVRGLVLGPPPGDSKSEDDMPLPSEIDEIVDLSKDDQLMLDRLQPLLDRSRSHHPR